MAGTRHATDRLSEGSRPGLGAPERGATLRQPLAAAGWTALAGGSLILLLGCPAKTTGKQPGVEALPPAISVPPAAVPVPPAPAAQPAAPIKARLARLPRKPKVPVSALRRLPAAEASVAPALPPPQLVPPAPSLAVVTPPVAVPIAAPAASSPATPASPAAPKAKAAYRRLVASYGAQLALVSPTNGGLRLAAGGPSVALGVNMVWSLPKGLRLRPRLDYTVFTGETRSSTAPPLPQTLNTRVSSLALGADLLVPLGPRWSVGLAVSEIRWSVASTNTVTPTLGGSLTLSGTSHWMRLGYGPVVTFKASEHLEVELRALSSHYGYENQPASTATVGLLWRF
jgi:hypothetical protein